MKRSRREIKKLPEQAGKSGELMTRSEAAAYLRVSIQELQRREAEGLIQPVARTASFALLYSRENLDTAGAAHLKRRSAAQGSYTIEDAQRVFVALRGGKTAFDCVIDLGVHPDDLTAIMKAYARHTGSLFVPEDVMQSVNALPLEGTFPIRTPEDLVEVLTLAANDMCRTCEKNARVLCKRCAVKERPKRPAATFRRSQRSATEQQEEEDEPEEAAAGDEPEETSAGDEPGLNGLS